MSLPLPASIADVLDGVLVEEPTRPALIARHGQLTYAELDAEANAAAAALMSLGVQPGTRVAASLPNDVDAVVAFHGAMRLGAIWVGINEALAAPEKAHILDDCRAALLLTGPDLAPELDGVRVVHVEHPQSEWQDLLMKYDGAPRPQMPIDARAPAGIAYTSGTTGRPKGVVHSQRNLLVPGAVLAATRGYDATLRKGDCLPLTVLNMMVLTTLLVAQAGGCCVVMDRRDPRGIADWIAEHGITTWNGVPAMLHSLAHDDSVSASDLQSLTEVWSGGGDCPDAVRTAFESKFGRRVHATYGLSEAPTVVAIEERDGAYVPRASGRVLAHLEVTVRDDEDRVLPVGETGELCVSRSRRGRFANLYTPMLGYYANDTETAAALHGGTLRTGDIGYVDDDRNVFVRDRKKLLIVRGGANVYPAEVERVIHEVPGVTGCAVFGVPDERLGERVFAAVEGLADEDQLRARCQRQLARYKVPERFVFVAELPRNAMGKIERTSLLGLVTE